MHFNPELLVSRVASRQNSLNPSRNPSRCHSRATSPIVTAATATAGGAAAAAGTATNEDAAALPLMLCSLLQREFSGNSKRGGSRKGRKGEEEMEDEEG